MQWWTRFITRTWQPIRRSFLQKSLVRDCASLPNVSQTLFLSNSPIKGNQKPTERANRLAKKCHQECPYFWKSLYGECSVDSRPQIHVLLNDVQSGTYRELSFSSVSGLPENYVHQNEWNLPLSCRYWRKTWKTGVRTAVSLTGNVTTFLLWINARQFRRYYFMHSNQ